MLCIYAYQRGHREHSIVTPENVARDTHSPLFFLSQSSLLLIHPARSFVCLASTSRRPFLFHFSLHFFLVRFETWFYFFFIIIYIYIYIYIYASYSMSSMSIISSSCYCSFSNANMYHRLLCYFVWFVSWYSFFKLCFAFAFAMESFSVVYLSFTPSFAIALPSLQLKFHP